VVCPLLFCPVVLCPVVFDAQNRKAGEVKTSFNIVGLTGSALAAAKITTDKPSYLPSDTVHLADRISNLTQNQMLDGLTADTTVYKPDGSALWTQTATLAQLPPAGFKELSYGVNLAMAAAGTSGLWEIRSSLTSKACRIWRGRR
jgi:hypothetical protein